MADVTGREVDSAVALLKLVCDPRGHDLLDALADLARTATRVADELEGHPVYWDNERHSKRLTDEEAEQLTAEWIEKHGRHSRRAGLRGVS